MNGTFEERKIRWEYEGVCECKRVDRAPMYAFSDNENPGEAWDVCCICGKTFEREKPVKLIYVYDRGLFWAIPTSAWELHFRPFSGCHEQVFHGAFDTFAEAVECAQNIYAGLTEDQPIAEWLYNPAPVISVEMEQEIPA